MLCADCGDLVSPAGRDLVARWCNCRRHAAWWVDGARGIFAVHDAQFPARNGGDGGRAWVIGLHNGLLTRGGLTHETPRMARPELDMAATTGNSCTTAADVTEILAITPDTYIFKRARSLAIRFTPGHSGDTMWAAQLPPGGETA